MNRASDITPLNERGGEHGDSSHAAVAQPRLQRPYLPVDQKLFAFSLAIPSMPEKPEINQKINEKLGFLQRQKLGDQLKKKRKKQMNEWHSGNSLKIDVVYAGQ